MPLLFFHLHDGPDVVLDPNGRDIESLPDMRQATLSEARGIISADARDGLINLACEIRVETAEGETIHRLRFRDAVRVIQPETP